MSNYPPQLPPPPPPPSGYNPFNPYSGYDPTADYVPWMPGRQGPRFIPIALVVGAILICSCCSFFVGTIFGIELPGFLQPSSPPAQQERPAQDTQPQEEPMPEESPTPEGGFQWRLTYPLALHAKDAANPSHN